MKVLALCGFKLKTSKLRLLHYNSTAHEHIVAGLYSTHLSSAKADIGVKVTKYSAGPFGRGAQVKICPQEKISLIYETCTVWLAAAASCCAKCYNWHSKANADENSRPITQNCICWNRCCSMRGRKQISLLTKNMMKDAYCGVSQNSMGLDNTSIYWMNANTCTVAEIHCCVGLSHCQRILLGMMVHSITWQSRQHHLALIFTQMHRWPSCNRCFQCSI